VEAVSWQDLAEVPQIQRGRGRGLAAGEVPVVAWRRQWGGGGAERFVAGGLPRAVRGGDQGGRVPPQAQRLLRGVRLRRRAGEGLAGGGEEAAGARVPRRLRLCGRGAPHGGDAVGLRPHVRHQPLQGLPAQAPLWCQCRRRRGRAVL